MSNTDLFVAFRINLTYTCSPTAFVNDPIRNDFDGTSKQTLMKNTTKVMGL